MDRQYQHANDGQEVSQGDVNLLGEVSGLAGDRVHADLVQLRQSSGVGVVGAQKAVMPFHSRAGSSGPFHGILGPSGSADASLRVYPFRAVVGPRTVSTGPSEDRVLDIRSAYHLPPDGSDRTTVTLDPTVGNNRVDLIYAAVTLATPSATVTRYVKAAGGTVSAQTVSQYVQSTVALFVEKGTEAASPARPSIPSDVPDTTYYVPLAYVWLTHPFTAGSTILDRQIEEVAPVRGQNPGRTAGANAGPIGEAWAAGSALKGADPYSVSKRPDVYMAPSMSGLVVRFFGLDQQTDITIPASSTRTLDSTIDWRHRLFKVRVQARDETGTRVAWEAGAVASPSDAVPTDEDSGSPQTHETFGQSFQQDFSTLGGLVCFLDNTAISRMSGSIAVYVDKTTGQLKCETGSPDAGMHFFFWIEATGQFKTGGDPAFL
jgi:hypothetical protein